MAESAVSGQFFKDILNEMHALYLRQQGSKALDADLLLCESRDTKGARMIFSACYVRYMCVCALLEMKQLPIIGFRFRSPFGS